MGELAKPKNQSWLSEAIPHSQVVKIEGGTICMINQMSQEMNLSEEDLKNFKEIYDWLEGLGYPDNFQQRANLQSALQQNNANTGTVYSDGTLIVTTAQYQPNISINFIDLYPVSLGGLEFNTQGTDVEYLQGSVSFAYRKYSIDILK